MHESKSWVGSLPCAFLQLQGSEEAMTVTTKWLSHSTIPTKYQSDFAPIGQISPLHHVPAFISCLILWPDSCSNYIYVRKKTKFSFLGLYACNRVLKSSCQILTLSLLKLFLKIWQYIGWKKRLQVEILGCPAVLHLSWMTAYLNPSVSWLLPGSNQTYLKGIVTFPLMWEGVARDEHNWYHIFCILSCFSSPPLRRKERFEKWMWLCFLWTAEAHPQKQQIPSYICKQLMLHLGLNLVFW